MNVIVLMSISFVIIVLISILTRLRSSTANDESDFGWGVNVIVEMEATSTYIAPSIILHLHLSLHRSSLTSVTPYTSSHLFPDNGACISIKRSCRQELWVNDIGMDNLSSHTCRPVQESAWLLKLFDNINGYRLPQTKCHRYWLLEL